MGGRRDLMIAGGLALALMAGPALAGGIGRPAPGFKITTFDHQTVSLDDLRGQVVILNFWAVWCGPCREEMQVLDSYVRKHGAEGLRIYAVTVDDTASDRQLRPLAKALAFSLATRIQGWGYGAIGGAVPTSYVIDRAGVLRYARADAFTEDSLEAVVAPLLAQAEPAPSPAQGLKAAALTPGDEPVSGR